MLISTIRSSSANRQTSWTLVSSTSPFKVGVELAASMIRPGIDYARGGLKQ